MSALRRLLPGLALAAASACQSHGSTGATSGPDAFATSLPEAGAARRDSATTAGQCTGAVATTGVPSGATTVPPAVTIASGFKLEVIATVESARQLVPLPNGDLIVSTKGTDVWLVPNAEASGAADAAVLFTTVNDPPVQGAAFNADSCTLAIASQHAVYSLPYRDGQTTAAPGSPIARVRRGPVAHSVDASVDTDTHTTTSLTYAGGKLYAGVGSSCNACVEVDPTRATVQEMSPDGSGMATRATRIRNAIAVTTNPATGTVWVGGAGQDELALGHPYEFFDALTAHPGVADYGWPSCEQDRQAFTPGADCSHTVVPRVELPAYSTLIGAAFYPVAPRGAYAFPAAYQGGLFITAHGSWHTNPDGTYFSPPRVVFVAMNGDTPATPVDWSDPTRQWVEFISGFQLADGKTRVGRPTGAAVGAEGSLFIADDQTNLVYRVRPQ